MPTPFPSRQTAASNQTDGAKAGPAKPRSAEWRCTRCGKLLGVLREGGLHLRFTGGHEYLVTLPGTCTCRGCRALNTIANRPGIPTA